MRDTGYWIASAVLILFMIGYSALDADLSGYSIWHTEPISAEELAKCLTQSGAKMYGASWCGHCANQKEMFGDAWQYIDYIECYTEDGEISADCADIQGFPTWVFADGSRIEGAASFEQLRNEVGC